MKPAKWLDSSAVLALLMAEPGYETVRDILTQAEGGHERVLLSQISLVEVAHAIARSHGDETARDDVRLILEMPMEIQGGTNDQFVRAGLLRSHHRLSTANAVILVQAQDAGAVLVHKDPEFEGVAGVQQLRLPYKPTKKRLRTTDHRLQTEDGR